MSAQTKPEDKKDKKVYITYSLDDVAAMLECTRQTVSRYIKENKLRASKNGKRYIITENALKEFLNERGAASA